MAKRGTFELKVERNELPQIGGRTVRLLNQVIGKVAHDIEATAKQSLSGPRTGRIYEKGRHEVSFTTKKGVTVSFVVNARKRRRTHQASAPGEAPATDTGALRNSIRTRKISDLAREITVGAEYAAALEFGTAKMAARPFLGPAVEAHRETFRKAVLAAVEQAAGGKDAGRGDAPEPEEPTE